MVFRKFGDFQIKPKKLKTSSKLRKLHDYTLPPFCLLFSCFVCLFVCFNVIVIIFYFWQKEKEKKQFNSYRRGGHRSTLGWCSRLVPHDTCGFGPMPPPPQDRPHRPRQPHSAFGLHMTKKVGVLSLLTRRSDTIPQAQPMSSLNTRHNRSPFCSGAYWGVT